MDTFLTHSEPYFLSQLVDQYVIRFSSSLDLVQAFIYDGPTAPQLFSFNYTIKGIVVNIAYTDHRYACYISTATHYEVNVNPQSNLVVYHAVPNAAVCKHAEKMSKGRSDIIVCCMLNPKYKIIFAIESYDPAVTLDTKCRAQRSTKLCNKSIWDSISKLYSIEQAPH